MYPALLLDRIASTSAVVIYVIILLFRVSCPAICGVVLIAHPSGMYRYKGKREDRGAIWLCYP